MAAQNKPPRVDLTFKNYLTGQLSELEFSKGRSTNVFTTLVNDPQLKGMFKAYNIAKKRYEETEKISDEPSRTDKSRLTRISNYEKLLENKNLSIEDINKIEKKMGKLQTTVDYNQQFTQKLKSEAAKELSRAETGLVKTTAKLVSTSSKQYDIDLQKQEKEREKQKQRKQKLIGGAVADIGSAIGNFGNYVEWGRNLRRG